MSQCVMALIRPSLLATVALLLAACSSSGGSTKATQSTGSAAATTPVAVTTAAAPTTAAATTTAAVTTAAATTTTVAAVKVSPPTAAECPAGAPAHLSCVQVAVPIDPTKPAGPTLATQVTLRRADPAKWTSPILWLASGSQPRIDWKDLAFYVPENFVGHDLVIVDLRGGGRTNNDGGRCANLNDYTAEINTFNVLPDAAAAIKACIAKANANNVPLLSTIDHSVAAADLVAVRKSLGIEKWMLYSSTGGADVALHLLKADAAAITAYVARDPNAVGTALSTTSLAEAFDRFAADCAAAPKCAANGDLKAKLATGLARLKTPVTTKTKEVVTGNPVVLDALVEQAGARFALQDPTFASILPGLISGLATGEADELVAGFEASQDPGTDPTQIAMICQDLGYGFTALKPVGDDKGGLFVGMSNKRYCDAIGPIPQLAAAPKITSTIPVFVVLSSYVGNSSETIAKSLFAGFTNATFTTVPGVSAASQKVGCYTKVLAAFFDAPTTKADPSCLQSPENRVFS